MFGCVLLYSTTFSRPVEYLELGVDNLLYQLIRFRCEHRSFRVFFQNFNSWLVHKERIVEYMKLVVKNTEGIALRHFVTFAFPAKSLVVVRIHVSSDVNWLKYLRNDFVSSILQTSKHTSQ
jgi:hypothetical protein